jgi:DNA polymerase III sliding clamp (beta) subunit (PCNA family)
VGPPAAPACHAPADPCRALAAVIGARPLRVLLRLLDELKAPFEPAELDWTSDGRLRVRSKDLQFTSRQLVGRFPSWRESFPPPSPHRGHFVRSDRLLAILKRAKMLAYGDRPALRISLRRGGLTLSVASGTGVERFETYCDWRSEPSEAVLDARPLIEVLEAIGGEAVDLELNGPGVPCVLHAAELRYCMMPLDSGPQPSATADRSGMDLGSQEGESDKTEGGALESRLPDSAG